MKHFAVAGRFGRLVPADTAHAAHLKQKTSHYDKIKNISANERRR
jgi:hypothetical protein